MKKKRNLYITGVGLFLLTGLLLISCSKDDDSYTFSGESKNKVFFNVGTYITSLNTYVYNVTRTPIGSFSNINASFPVYTTFESAENLTVSCKIDNSLIDAFNEKNATNYKAAPEGIIVLINNSLTIQKGATISSDSLKVSTTDRLSELTEDKYLVPIVIYSVTGDGNTEVSSNLNVVYFDISTAFTNCYTNPALSDMEGVIISSRTSWTASLDIPDYTNSLTNLFDARTNTYVSYAPQVSNLTVDMASEKIAITGIRTSPYSTSYRINAAEVLSSTDGTNWESQGIARLASGTYQYIKFYQPITARYLRLRVTEWYSTRYIRFGEFDVYTGIN